MNKNLLVIAAAATAYALLRPKSTPLLASRGSGATGAASYVPTTTTTTTTAPGWAGTVSNVVGAAGTAVGIIKTGSSLWDELKGALHIPATQAPTQADVTADQSAGIWAGPKTQIS
jgi:hypothetical protein